MGSIDETTPYASNTTTNPYLTDYSTYQDSDSSDTINGNAQISSMAQFKEDYPSLYEAMSKTIAQTTLDQMKSSNDRINKMIHDSGDQ